MELEFLIDDVRYAFGVVFGAEGFKEEWLYKWPGARRVVMYHRSIEEDTPWYYGPSLKGQRARIAEATRANSLFLSVAAQQNHGQLLPVYRAIVDGIRLEKQIELRGFPLFEADALLLCETFRPTLLRLLSAADVGISDLRVSPLKLSPTESQVHCRFVHGDTETGTWELPPSHESRGTQILLARLGDFAATLASGGLLVLDEIDTSLHPDLCVELLRLFTDESTNPKGAQLLFSSHDRDLLNALRTDEIVLVDKASDGSSTCRAASDYSRTRDGLRTAHERGRLGGVPILRSFTDAFTS